MAAGIASIALVATWAAAPRARACSCVNGRTSFGAHTAGADWIVYGRISGMRVAPPSAEPGERPPRSLLEVSTTATWKRPYSPSASIWFESGGSCGAMLSSVTVGQEVVVFARRFDDDRFEATYCWGVFGAHLGLPPDGELSQALEFLRGLPSYSRQRDSAGVAWATWLIRGAMRRVASTASRRASG